MIVPLSLKWSSFSLFTWPWALWLKRKSPIIGRSSIPLLKHQHSIKWCPETAGSPSGHIFTLWTMRLQFHAVNLDMIGYSKLGMSSSWSSPSSLSTIRQPGNFLLMRWQSLSRDEAHSNNTIQTNQTNGVIRPLCWVRRTQAMPYRWLYILEKLVTLIPKPSQDQWHWVLSSNWFLPILARVIFCSQIAIILHQQLQIFCLQTRLASVEHAMLIGLGCRMTFAPATCPWKKEMTLHSGARFWCWHARGKTSNVSHSCPLWTTTHLHLWLSILGLLLLEQGTFWNLLSLRIIMHSWVVWTL